MILNGNYELSTMNSELRWISKFWKSFHNSKFTIQNSKFKLVALFLILAAQAYGQAGTPLTTGADFLLMTTGARPDGMGQAFSAVADDINTLTFNPAGLANIRLPEVGYGHESFVADIGYDFVGAAVPTGEAGVFGLGYIGMGTAPFNSTANAAAAPVAAQDRAIIAGWGKSFYDVHVGVGVKYIMRQIDTVQGSGFGFDLGVRYRVFPYLTVAASGLNIGPGIKMASVEPLPTVLNFGGAWTALEESNHLLNFTSDISYNIITNTPRWGFGAEYWYKNTVAIRCGYLANSIDEGFSAGAGVQVSFVQLDYAFQPFNTLGSVHRFSGIVRWDGPWVKGSEPNAPKYLNVKQAAKALEIRWEKSRGPADGYEVVIQPMDGRDPIVSEALVNPIYYFKDFEPDTLYKVSVRAVGNGGVRSFPSKESYIMPEGPEYHSESLAVEGKPSISRGVNGKVDAAGLQLYWDIPADGAPGGYNLYRKSPSGIAQKVTLEPKRENRVWMTDASGLQGWEWIVTVLAPDGKTEKTIGTYLWYPTSKEVDSLVEKPTMNLHASPQKDRKVYLDWDDDPDAAGYVMLFSRQPDGIFEVYGDMKSTEKDALLQIAGKHTDYYFIVVPKDAQGVWLKKSKGAKAELTVDEMGEESGD